jgi:hypothetical protein
MNAGMPHAAGHLLNFLGRASRDPRISTPHVMLFLGLFQQWAAGSFQNPIVVNRKEVMAVAKISSRVTYHKCIRELHRWGYLYYEPSYDYYRGSLVFLYYFRERQPGGE